MPKASALAALEKAVKGLTYQSETDEPFEVFLWKAEDVGEDLTEPKAAELHGDTSESDVERISLEQFFAPLLRSQKWHRQEEAGMVRQYQVLFDTIQAHLQDARVYKIGTTEKALYVVGKTTAGDWAGVKTIAVET